MTHDERRARNRAMWFEFRAGATLSQLVSKYQLGRKYTHRIVRTEKPPVGVVWDFDAPQLVQQMHQPVDTLTAEQKRKASWQFVVRGPDARALRMIEMYRAGLTLQQIGDRYQVTRERARQILRRWECAPEVGGQKLKTIARATAKHAEREQRWIKRYGCGYADWQAIGEYARKRYGMQKKTARSRGIEWSLTLKQWWDLWQKSGHWDARGRNKHSYCMARVGDKGGYTFGNVYITTMRENGQEYQQTRKRDVKRDLPVGVYNLYPGTGKPFVARHGRTNLGYFATAEDAATARIAYMKQAGKRAA